jgi:hypothetical protein
MIMTCILDLRVFLTTFFLLITFSGMMLSVLGRNPTMEYSHLSPFMGNFMSALRISLGDFDFTQLTVLTAEESITYWTLWVFIFLMGCLIFMNFIITEVGESYAKVLEDIDALIYKERSIMVKEIEDFLSDKFKETHDDIFPKYVVVREETE